MTFLIDSITDVSSSIRQTVVEVFLLAMGEGKPPSANWSGSIVIVCGDDEILIQPHVTLAIFFEESKRALASQDRKDEKSGQAVSNN